MVILAVDTTTRTGSLGLWRDGRAVGAAGSNTRTHAERLPLEVEAWLSAQRLSLGDVTLIAVAAGPGSFTGLRVGLAAVQGLALPRQMPTLGVPTFDAMAAGWHDAHRTDALLVTTLDAQRDEIFLAAYRTRATGERVEAGDVVREAWVDARAQVPAALERLAQAHADVPLVVLIGGGTDPRVGAAALIEALHTSLPSARVEEPTRPLAADVALAASQRVAQAGAPHALRPLYVRRPDVELARERARAPVR